MSERKYYLSFAELLIDIDKMNVGLDLKKTFTLPNFFLATKDGKIHQAHDLNSFINILTSVLGVDIIPWSGVDAVPLSLVYNDYSSEFKIEEIVEQEVEVVKDKPLTDSLPQTETIETQVIETDKVEKSLEDMTAKEIIKLLTDAGEVIPKIINKTQLIKLVKTKFGEKYGNTATD
jgi:hypothetical protein